MDMVLYALLKKEMSNFEFVSEYRLEEVAQMPNNPDSHTIYIVNPDKEGDK